MRNRKTALKVYKHNERIISINKARTITGKIREFGYSAASLVITRVIFGNEAWFKKYSAKTFIGKIYHTGAFVNVGLLTKLFFNFLRESDYLAPFKLLSEKISHKEEQIAAVEIEEQSCHTAWDLTLQTAHSLLETYLVFSKSKKDEDGNPIFETPEILLALLLCTRPWLVPMLKKSLLTNIPSKVDSSPKPTAEVKPTAQMPAEQNSNPETAQQLEEEHHESKKESTLKTRRIQVQPCIETLLAFAAESKRTTPGNSEAKATTTSQKRGTHPSTPKSLEIKVSSEAKGTQKVDFLVSIQDNIQRKLPHLKKSQQKRLTLRFQEIKSTSYKTSSEKIFQFQRLLETIETQLFNLKTQPKKHKPAKIIADKTTTLIPTEQKGAASVTASPLGFFAYTDILNQHSGHQPFSLSLSS